MGPLILQAAVAVVMAVGGAVGLYLFLSWLLGVTPHPTDPSSDQQKLLADLVKVALGLAAGVGAAFALVVGYRRARVEEASSHRDDRRLFSVRYQDAADLVGHDKAAVRLAGIYAMSRLADDWIEQRQQCIDVLCAYLRLPYDPAASDPGEREVRLTVIRIITAHLRPSATLTWQEHDLDFTGAVFDGGDFRGADFSEATITFRGAKFSGGIVYFGGTEFSGGTVDFSGAKFSGGTVYFGEAKFSGSTVYFDEAEFAGQPGTPSTTNYFGPDGAWTGGTATGIVYFGAAVFSGGTVDFRRTIFSGGAVYFGGAKFSGGTVDFGGTEFSGSTVYFDEAEFSGGTVDLSKARLRSGCEPPRALPVAPNAGLRLADWMKQA
jgi:uncharacterized protein YjbI with pentapeptide repeats